MQTLLTGGRLPLMVRVNDATLRKRKSGMQSPACGSTLEKERPIEGLVCGRERDMSDPPLSRLRKGCHFQVVAIFLGLRLLFLPPHPLA